MNRSEFMEMHENCVSAMRAYFAEAETMSAMLAEGSGAFRFGSEQVKMLYRPRKGVPCERSSSLAVVTALLR
jgi:hypothetical protein